MTLEVHVPSINIPRGMQAEGRKLYRAIATEFDLRPDELRLLEDACREADIIATLETARADASLIVRGSMGQEVINPLISELRQHRATLAALLKALHLTEDSVATRSTNARAAANARWTRRTG